MGLLGNATAIIFAAAASTMQPAPPLHLEKFAVENIVFRGNETSFPGAYNPDIFPEFSDILDALGPNAPSREVTLRKSAQGGGTIIAQIFVAANLTVDPHPCMFVHPTSENAKKWSKTKWMPFLRGTTCLRSVINIDGSRESKTSILYQERTDGAGFISAAGANSPATLSMITISRMVQDDLSKWEVNAAGDPEDQADSRCQAQEFAKIFKVSTPLVNPGCKISAAFNRGTREYFHVPCPHCGFKQRLEWENLLASVTRVMSDKSTERRDSTEAHFTCIDCGAAIEDHHREKMKISGEWIAEKPQAKNRSFHYWSGYSLLMSLERIVDRWYTAEGDPSKEQTFYNDVVGRPYEVSGDAPNWEEIRDRASESCYERGTVPVGALILCAGIDVHGDRLEIHVKGYGSRLRSWTIDYVVIPGNIAEDETQENLEKYLNKARFRDVYGNLRSIKHTAIDSGYATSSVYDWAKRIPDSQVMPVKGSNSESAAELVRSRPEEQSASGIPLKFRKRLWLVGVSRLKMVTFINIKKTDPEESGYIGVPTGLDDIFFEQYCNERRIKVKNKKTGYENWQWRRMGPNEVLDTAVYADAAAIRIGWKRMTEDQWDVLSAELEVEPEQSQLSLEDPDLSKQVKPDLKAERLPQKNKSKRSIIDQLA